MNEKEVIKIVAESEKRKLTCNDSKTSQIVAVSQR
jgi:hypothetical protein